MVRWSIALLAGFLPFLTYANQAVVGECREVKSFVSKDTCQKNQQCGTPALPFCTIGQGISIGGTVKVAASSKPYEERIVLTDNVHVEGGYETSFASFTAFGSSRLVGSVTFVPGAHGSLKRFDIDEPVIKKTESEHLPKRSEAITLPGNAEVRLESVRTNLGVKNPGYPVAKVTSAVFVEESAGGKLELVSVDLRSLPAEERSTALAVHAQNFELSAARSSFTSSTAPRTIAAGFWGAGKVTLTQSEFHPGAGVASAGIRAVGPESKTDLSVRVIESKVEGSVTSTPTLPYLPTHLGISTRNANLEVRQSEVVGSLNEESRVARAIEAKGITKTQLVVAGNSRILGAIGRKYGYGQDEEVSAVYVVGDVDAVIQKNKHILGCANHCLPTTDAIHLNGSYEFDHDFSIWNDFKTADITVRAAPVWKILENEQIVGGPGPSGYRHAGVFAAGARNDLPTLQLLGNKLVAGSVSKTATPLTSAMGLYVISVNSTVKQNRFSAGLTSGYPVAPGRYGVKFESVSSPLTRIAFEQNWVEGGPEGTAAEFIGVSAHVEKNLMTRSEVGLSFHQDRSSMYLDNTIVGRFGVLAGCTNYNRLFNECGQPGNFTFRRNVIFATDPRGWGIILGSRTAESKITRNVIQGNRPVILNPEFNSEYPEFTYNLVFSNSPKNCTYVKFGSWACEKSKPAEFGENNVGIYPQLELLKLLNTEARGLAAVFP